MTAGVIDRVPVPAGTFLYGGHHAEDGRVEVAPREVFVSAFHIDRHPVTVAASAEMIAAGGYRERKHWSRAGWQWRVREGIDKPRFWDEPEWAPYLAPDHPVVGVSAYEAEAYAAFRGAALPTEAEWEKACRGPSGNIYPWGDAWEAQRANVDGNRGLSREPGDLAWKRAWDLLQSAPAAGEPGLRPVGSYPSGASPYGVMDMAGSASEWVLDWYNWGDYSGLPLRNPINIQPPWNHCVRGSAWHDPAGFSEQVALASRCSTRSSAHASADPRLGFRCARSIP